MMPRGFGLSPDTEPEQRPPGEKYAEEWNPTPEDDTPDDAPAERDTSDEEDDERKPNRPASFGEERHPTQIVSWGTVGTEAYQIFTLKYATVEWCGGDTYRLTGEVEQYPPTDEVLLSVQGTRRGDTDRLEARVVDADPLTLVVDTQSPTLYRLAATGCLVCGGEQA